MFCLLVLIFNSMSPVHQDHMNGRSFSFWKWFYGALDVVSRRLLDEWRDGYVSHIPFLVCI